MIRLNDKCNKQKEGEMPTDALNKTNKRKTKKPRNKTKNKEEMVTKEDKPTVNKSISTCGFLCWWEFKGSEITPTNLQLKLDKYDELKTITVPSINKISALTQTVREFRFSKDIRVRTEIASQDEKEIAINLLERKKVDKTKVEWHECDTLIYDVGSLEWLSKGQSQIEQVIEARKAFLDHVDRKSTFLDNNYIRPYIFKKKLDD